MNISLKKNDTASSGILTIDIVKADYAETLEKSMRSFRQKVAVPGFRKGMVPLSMVKKMHGSQLLAEELNKMVSESLYNYIQGNKLNVLGEPMPNTTEQPELDFDKQEDFTFCFDLAFAPEIKFELNKKDKLVSYLPVIDDEMVNSQVQSYCSNFGSYDQVEGDVEAKDLLKGTLVELENGVAKEGGVVVEDAVLMPEYMKDEDEKTKFLNSKKGVVVFNPNKAYDGSAIEIASLLKIEKEFVPEMVSDFSFDIKEVTRHKGAELNQELFDKVFGDGVVSNEDEFKNKIKESLIEQFTPQSNYKFLQDARDLLIAKVGDIALADDLLKRWLVATDKKNTVENVEENYSKIVEDLKYQLIKESLVKENNIKVDDADIEAFAHQVAKAQFAQYGMLSMPDDLLNGYVKDMLKNKQTLQSIIDRVVEEKLSDVLKGLVSVDIKEVSMDDFNKLFE
jgi:trigger factor